MSRVSKRCSIVYIILIYFLVSCAAIFYLSSFDFPPLMNSYLWQYRGSNDNKYLFLNINHKRWDRLQKTFSNSNLSLLWDGLVYGNNTKTLTYRCESFCGGLGDRLRGIVSSYFLALVLRRKFMIYMNYPCDITRLFSPNMYNWTYHTSKSNLTRLKKVINAIDHNSILHELRNIRFVDRWAKYDDIDIYTNLDLLTIIFSNSALRQNAVINMFLQHMLPEEANFQTLFALLFEILFTPSTKVIDLIDPILKRAASANDSLLCLHIRMGKNPSNPEDQLLDDRTTIADDMIAFLKTDIIPKGRKLLILVASDSYDAISKVQEHFPNQSVAIQGPILHIDRPSPTDNIEEGCLSTVATFYILGECDISLLTNSGFSALANRRRIDPYANLYKYDFKKKRIERCENVVFTSQWEPAQSAMFVLYCPVLVNFTVREL